MKIAILGELGEILNVIIATPEFAELHYPGKWQALAEDLPTEEREMPEVVVVGVAVEDDPLGLARVSAEFHDVRLPVGSRVVLTVALRLGGETLEDFTAEFTMPLKSTDGALRFINVPFINGVAVFSAHMNDSKRWEATEALINSGLTPDHQMRFAGMVITAVE